MKKVLLGLMLLSFSFAVTIEYGSNPNIRSTNGVVRRGYQSLQLEMKNVRIVSPSTTLTWYADNIGGYSTISLYGLDVANASANATTISAQAVYANGVAVKDCAVQVITSGTPTATIKSPYYKFIYASNTTTTVSATEINGVSLNFWIND